MEWTLLLSAFFAGAFLVNAIPHFVHGVSGQPFQSPFASPPGVGESGPVVNVLWGSANIVAGYALLQMSDQRLPLALGGLCMGLILAWHFERVRTRG